MPAMKVITRYRMFFAVLAYKNNWQHDPEADRKHAIPTRSTLN